MIVIKKIEDIDSFDAVYKNVILRNSTIIIPYVSLGVPRRLLSASGDELVFLNYSYVILKEVFYLSVFDEGQKKRYPIINSVDNADKFCFGGNYLDVGTHVFNDMYVSCKEVLLELLNFSDFSQQAWRVENLPVSIVEEFFNHEFMPSDIQNMLS